MAKTKAQPRSQSAATSKTWVYKLYDIPRRSDDPAAPKDYTHFCDEGDNAWTIRPPEKEVSK